MNTAASTNLPSMQAPVIENRRRSVRSPKVLDAWICSPTSTDPLRDREEVTSVNVSRHGVGFTIHHELPLGTFYVIEMGIGAQLVVTEMRITVCREVDSRQFEVGAEFC